MLNVRGLVTRVTDIGEYDRLINIVTAETGVVSALCRGVRRIKSKRLAAASLLTYSEFTLSETRQGYTVDEAQPIEVFYGLRQSITSLALGQYLCELFGEFMTQGVEAKEPFRLLLNSLYLISEEKKDYRLIKAVTELRLLSDSGFMPNIVGCRVCGEYEKEQMYFDLREGSLICSDCNPAGELFCMTPALLKAVRYIILSDFERIFSFTLAQRELDSLAELAQRYLIEKTGRSFKTLDFYNSCI